MPTVQNIIKNAAGNAVTGGIVVNIDLVILDGSGNATIPQGFVDLGSVSTDYSINVGTTVTANSTTGVWTAVLVGNPDISQATSSLYRIIENTSTPRTYYINVPSAGGPYWVGSILSSTPSASGAVIQPTRSFRTITAANYTLINADDVVMIDCTTADRTLTLPLASAVTVGKVFEIKNITNTTTARTINVTPSGTDILLGFRTVVSGTVVATNTVSNGVTASRSYASDGTKWVEIS